LRHDILQNGTQHNDNLTNDAQHNNKKRNTHHIRNKASSAVKLNAVFFTLMPSVVLLDVVLLNVVAPLKVRPVSFF
jgi:hypothetical protein